MPPFLAGSFALAPTHFIGATCRRAGRDLPRSLTLRTLHATSPIYLPRRREFFSSNVQQLQKQLPVESSESKENAKEAVQRRKPPRSPLAKNSLRRVAMEAERSRDSNLAIASGDHRLLQPKKLVSAYAVAEQFDLSKVMEILRDKGYEPDPANTGLYPQVIHIQIPTNSIYRTSNISAKELSPEDVGDVFIFPSGTVVAWDLPEHFTSYFATKILFPAAENPHIRSLETEELEYIEDPSRSETEIRGDTIILGIKDRSDIDQMEPLSPSVNTVLTKVAISSGFARSTKLAVLETMLQDYIDSTRNIPTLLSRGSRLPFNRAFILRKTGQLLSLRAQLNLYSELTDSLPDMLWDSRQELNLEDYYDRVGRALDVGIRIKVLNEKMDYAQEIASVLRERLSEKHGLVLEWTIIILIAVEVGFEILRLWKEAKEEAKHENIKAT